MARFVFKLATVLRLREAARDERRGRLAEAYRAAQALDERRASLVEETHGLQDRMRSGAVGALNVDQLSDANRYAAVLSAEIRQVDAQAATLAAEIERRRKSLIEADRDVRVLERLRDKQRDRHAQQEAAREMKELDEIALRRATFEEASR